MEQSDTFSERVKTHAARLCESSPAATTGLYDLTAQRLVRYAATITRHQDDAEDAVQTTLVKIAGQPRLLQSSNQPWAYLLRMVRNEALAILRRRRHWYLVQNLTDLITRRLTDQLEGEDRNEAVWQALRELPTLQSEVVVLKIWEEMTFQQISQVLEIPPSTAASRYRYAIEKLGQKLRPLASEEASHV
ncbi:MAG: sigma-70 family RNA polymerase sigma factor [Planctomycetota bacterium]|nr:sigma-70 family RNA polymerase sigma factor [Planctomycetota bacterium]